MHPSHFSCPPVLPEHHLLTGRTSGKEDWQCALAFCYHPIYSLLSRMIHQDDCQNHADQVSVAAFSSWVWQPSRWYWPDYKKSLYWCKLQLLFNLGMLICMKYESAVFRRHAVTESWRFKCSLWQSCAWSESPTVSCINALGPLWVCRNTRLQRKVRCVCGQGTFIYSNCWFVAQKCRYNSLGFIFSNGALIQDLEFFQLVSKAKSIGRKSISLWRCI